MGFFSNLKHGWNAFRDPNAMLDDNTDFTTGVTYGGYSGQSANFLRGYRYNKSDLIKSVITRIALDAAMVDIQHLKINEKDGSQSKVNSGLINALTTEANLDQSGFAFRFDLFWSLLEEGCIAVVPVETDSTPSASGAYNIDTMRVGKIMQWYPKKVRVRLYNENTGTDQDIVIDKRLVAIIESPLYSLMQEGNQTLKLLQAKINRMNSEDSNAASGKLNGFLKVAYATKNSTRKQQADKRRTEIEGEMAQSKYGLATLDVTEQYIPAGAGLTNNLLDDIRKLQTDFFNQTGMTQNILDGTAEEKEMLNYYNRTIDPIITAVLAELNRKFLTKTARTQGQVLSAFRDPFKLVPVEQIAQIADIFTRNAILTPNEIRKFVGKEPHPDPTADQLFNRNIADGNQAGGLGTVGQGGVTDQASLEPESSVPETTPATQGNDNNVPEVPDFISKLQQTDIIKHSVNQQATQRKRTNFVQNSKNYMVRSVIKRRLEK